MDVPTAVTIREVGLRDGLQSRPQMVPTATKARMLKLLIAAGFRKINAVALVHPKAMPHMADAEDLLRSVGPVPDVLMSALVLNRKGLERSLALAADDLVDEVLFLHATTSGVLKANALNPNPEEARREVLDLAAEAKQHGQRTVVFISASFGCSIEGPVNPDVPLAIASELRSSGVVDEVAFSDSTGQANPLQVIEFFGRVKREFGSFPLTVHFHDTRGAGLANVLALFQVGLEELTIDSAFAGLGGDVPFLPEAGGNVCTEDLLSLLHGMGTKTGADLEKVLEVAEMARACYPDPVPSRLLVTGPIQWVPARL